MRLPLQFLLLIICILICFPDRRAWAQEEQSYSNSIFQILSPKDMDTVATNQLLVVFQLPQDYKLNYAEFRIVLDEMQDLTELIKIKGNFMSVLHDEKLRPGMHKIELYAKRKNGKDYYVVNTLFFRVLGTIRENKWLKQREFLQTGKNEKLFKINGSLQLLSNDVWLSGPGLANRQEPAFTREAALNFSLKYQKMEIPVNMLVTTNARGDNRYFNRFMIGFKRGRLAIYSGDQFVEEDRLILSGLRINGLMVTFPIGSETTLSTLVGRNVDYLLRDNNFPLLPNQSNALFSGGLPRYRRNYTYFKLSSSYNKSINQYSISFLKSYDIFGDSLLAGLTPKDNIVLGLENYYSFMKQRASLRLNIALSMLTENRAIPAASEQYEKVININASTSPLSMKNVENAAVQATYQVKIAKDHSFRVEGKRLGGSYNSLGNPYMLNNRNMIRATQRSGFFKGKIFLSLSYDFIIDNRNKTAMLTRENHSGAATLVLQYSRKWPVVTGGYRAFFGNTYGMSGLLNGKTTTENLFGSIQYSLKIKEVTQQITLSRNDMNLSSELISSNQQQMNDVSYAIQAFARTGIEFQAIETRQMLAGESIPQQGVSARWWIKFRKPDLRLYIRLNRQITTYGAVGKESRETLMGGIDYIPHKNIILNISGGQAPFYSYLDERNYKETFVQVRATLQM